MLEVSYQRRRLEVFWGFGRGGGRVSVGFAAGGWGRKFGSWRGCFPGGTSQVRQLGPREMGNRDWQGKKNLDRVRMMHVLEAQCGGPSCSSQPNCLLATCDLPG